MLHLLTADIRIIIGFFYLHLDYLKTFSRQNIKLCYNIVCIHKYTYIQNTDIYILGIYSNFIYSSGIPPASTMTTTAATTGSSTTISSTSVISSSASTTSAGVVTNVSSSAPLCSSSSVVTDVSSSTTGCSSSNVVDSSAADSPLDCSISTLETPGGGTARSASGLELAESHTSSDGGTSSAAMLGASVPFGGARPKTGASHRQGRPNSSSDEDETSAS